MPEQDFQKLLEDSAERCNQDQRAAAAMENRIVSRMIAASHKEEERLENHLLEMPLSVIIYKWVIVRLKSRPWRLLVPTSIALSLILQGLLSRFNLAQFLGR